MFYPDLKFLGKKQATAVTIQGCWLYWRHRNWFIRQRIIDRSISQGAIVWADKKQLPSPPMCWFFGGGRVQAWTVAFSPCFVGQRKKLFLKSRPGRLPSKPGNGSSVSTPNFCENPGLFFCRISFIGDSYCRIPSAGLFWQNSFFDVTRHSR